MENSALNSALMMDWRAWNVGVEEGDAEGDPEGLEDGAMDGEAAGSVDGDREGSAESDPDGHPDERYEGIVENDGTLDDPKVGVIEGMPDNDSNEGMLGESE